jgi:flagellar motor switch protein FliM
VGESLDLPANAVHATVLESSPGRVIARATLGQMSGQRALRLQGDTARPGPALPGEDAGQGDRGRAGDEAETGMRTTPAKVTPPAELPPQDQRVDPAAGLPDLSEFEIEDAPGDDTGDPGATPLIGMDLD